MATHYELLGIAPDATLSDIKKAYRQLARQYHPDAGQTTDSLRFLEITEAYQTLIDEEQRAVYDRRLKTQNARDVYDAAREMVAQQSAHRHRRQELRPFYWMLIGFVVFFFLMLIALAAIMLAYGPERVAVENEPNSVNWIVEDIYASYISGCGGGAPTDCGGGRAYTDPCIGGAGCTGRRGSVAEVRHVSADGGV